MTEPTIQMLAGFKGVLIIGDPLLGPHKRVGRSDDVWHAGMVKLERALDLAAEHQWLPIIVGDILHETREMSYLLPLIKLLKDRRALLLPRNTLWHDSPQGLIAAILQESGLAQVAGVENQSVVLTIEGATGPIEMTIEAHTPWGGTTRLERDVPGYLNVPQLGLTIHSSTGLPLGATDEHPQIKAGCLLRLSMADENKPVNVHSITPNGVQAHALEVTAHIFDESTKSVLSRQEDIERESLFVAKLRASTESSLEDEGKSSLMELIEEVKQDLELDGWMEKQLLSLAAEVAA